MVPLKNARVDQDKVQAFGSDLEVGNLSPVALLICFIPLLPCLLALCPSWGTWGCLHAKRLTGFGGETQEAQVRGFVGDQGRIQTAYGSISRLGAVADAGAAVPRHRADPAGVTSARWPEHAALCSAGSHRHQKRNSDV